MINALFRDGYGPARSSCQSSRAPMCGLTIMGPGEQLLPARPAMLRGTSIGRGAPEAQSAAARLAATARDIISAQVAVHRGSISDGRGRRERHRQRQQAWRGQRTDAAMCMRTASCADAYRPHGRSGRRKDGGARARPTVLLHENRRDCAHDMSAEQHEREAASHTRGRRGSRGAARPAGDCRSLGMCPAARHGGGGVCLSSAANPSAEHRRVAEAHRTEAERHRAASAALRDAEARRLRAPLPGGRDGR